MKVPTRTYTGVLPTKTALRGPSGEGGTPTAFGATVGQSLGNLSASTMALGQFVNEQEQKKQRFGALRALSRFQAEQRSMFEQAKRNNAPGSMNFYQTVGNSYREAERQFISSLPQELQDEFSVRTAEMGSALGLDAMQFQYETNDSFFKQGIQDALDEARLEVSQDATKPSLERQRAYIDEVIDASGVSEAEKSVVRRRAYQLLEGVAYRQAQLQRLQDERAGIGTDVDQAADLLATFSAVPPDEAADKAQQAASLAQQALGSLDVWAALPSRVRAVLISTTAMQGGLSNEIVAAVQSGDLDRIAESLREAGMETEGDMVLNPEAGIDNDPAFANVPYEDRLTLLADAQRQSSAEIAAENAAESAANKQLVNALHVALYEGTAGQTDIDAMKERGVLIDYDDIKKADEILRKRDEDLQLRLLGQQMMMGDVTFAPGNEDHAKVLNAMVGKEGLRAIDQKDSEYAANTLIPIVRQTGAVPTDVVDLLRGMIRSQDGDRAYWALDLMAQIERANPKAFMSFAEDDRNDLDFWQARRDYIPQEAMMNAIRGPVDPAERNARQALRKEGERLFSAGNGPLRNFNPVELFPLQGGFLGLGQTRGNLPATKWVGQQLDADFQTLFLDNYEKFGDVEAAKKAAATQLLRVWGTTSVGSDMTIMKYPPEKFYAPVRDSYTWMEEQLRRDGILADGEEFQLVTDTQTENEWGANTAPSYLLVKIVDGQSRLVFDSNGLPQRVFFDYGAQEQADEADWRGAQRRSQEITANERIMGMAIQHSLDTGVGIPSEMFDPDQPGGLLAALLEQDTAVGQQIRQEAAGP